MHLLRVGWDGRSFSVSPVVKIITWMIICETFVPSMHFWLNIYLFTILLTCFCLFVCYSTKKSSSLSILRFIFIFMFALLWMFVYPAQLSMIRNCFCVLSVFKVVPSSASRLLMNLEIFVRYDQSTKLIGILAIKISLRLSKKISKLRLAYSIFIFIKGAKILSNRRKCTAGYHFLLQFSDLSIAIFAQYSISPIACNASIHTQINDAFFEYICFRMINRKMKMVWKMRG